MVRGGGSAVRGAARRGSYFFVIDAFIAGAILVFTLITIFMLFAGERPSEQGGAYAQDYLLFLTTTEVRDYRHPDITALKVSSRRTLAEQAIVFHNESNASAAITILNTSAQTLPPMLGINVTLREGAKTSVLYNRSGLVSDPQTHLVAKSIEYALLNQSAIYGPVVLQVEVWS